MRLFEFSNEIVSTLELIFRNRIDLSNAKGAIAHYTWGSLSYELETYELGKIDYKGFKKLYDANSSLSNLVRGFDDDGVTLKTEKRVVPKKDKFDLPNAPSVDSMAHSAVKKHLRDISK